MYILLYTYKDFLSSSTYYKNGKWASDCSDPKKIFESIVSQPENVIDNVNFYDFDNNKDDLIGGSNIYEYDNWYYLDTYWYGRCVSLLTNNGIKLIKALAIAIRTIAIAIAIAAKKAIEYCNMQ